MASWKKYQEGRAHTDEEYAALLKEVSEMRDQIAEQEAALVELAEIIAGGDE